MSVSYLFCCASLPYLHLAFSVPKTCFHLECVSSESLFFLNVLSFGGNYCFTVRNFIIYLFIYFWLCWVFVSVRGLSLAAASGGHSSSRCAGLSPSRPLLLQSTGSRRTGSVAVEHGLSCSVACGIFPDQGSNPCPLHWHADSQPLHHQGSPPNHFYTPCSYIQYCVLCHHALLVMQHFLKEGLTIVSEIVCQADNHSVGLHANTVLTLLEDVKGAFQTTIRIPVPFSNDSLTKPLRD